MNFVCRNAHSLAARERKRKNKRKEKQSRERAADDLVLALLVFRIHVLRLLALPALAISSPSLLPPLPDLPIDPLPLQCQDLLPRLVSFANSKSTSDADVTGDACCHAFGKHCKHL
jgi:hypothetical protein